MDILASGEGLPSPVENLKDFVWSSHDEPHPGRRKMLLKEHGRKVSSLMGYEWKTKYGVLALMALQIYLAWYLRHEAPFCSENAGWTGTLKFWTIVYVVGATATQSLFLAEHEISHNLAFREFWKNKVFGVFANLPMVLPFFISFKEYHNEHHKYQGVDGIDTDLPTPLEAKLLSTFLGKAFFLFNQTWFYAFRPLLLKPKPFTLWHAINFSVQAAFITTIVRAWGWGSLIYLLSCAHWAGSFHPMASHFIAEHYVFVDDIETHSYYGPLNYLCWNVGYHNEHHDFPKVPWSRLPALRKIGGKDYDSLPRHESWPRVLIHFLFQPQIKLFNRIKRTMKLVKKR